MCYPVGLHFGISQIVAYAGLYFLVTRTGRGIDAYYSQAVMLTGITGLITLIPAWIFYKRDWRRRQYSGLLAGSSEISMRKAFHGCLEIGECVLLFLLGAALAEYMNIAVGLLTLGSDVAQSYNDTMAVMTDGKSFWFLVLWMGIAAPIAEESIFRWLIYLRLRDFTGPVLSAAVSGIMFGVYHGNLIQGIYASVLGFVFALVLEWSGSLASSALLHIGANVWSLALDEWKDYFSGGQGALIFGYLSLMFFFVIILGLVWFYKKYAAAGKERML